MIGWFSFGLCITFINKIDEKKRYFCHQNCFIFLLLFLSLIGPDDSCDMSRSYNVHRRKTDLMPTIPSPRDTCRSSLGTYTPRTPGSNWHDIKNFYLHFFSVQNCLKLLTHDAMFDLIRKVFFILRLEVRTSFYRSNCVLTCPTTSFFYGFYLILQLILTHPSNLIFAVMWRTRLFNDPLGPVV